MAENTEVPNAHEKNICSIIVFFDKTCWLSKAHYSRRPQIFCIESAKIEIKAAVGNEKFSVNHFWT